MSSPWRRSRAFAKATRPKPVEPALRKRCERHGLPPPDTNHELARGLKAHVWPTLDVALIVAADDQEHDRARIKAAGADGWTAVVCSPRQWADGSCLALVKRIL
jgi:hypothetical protein